MYHLQVIHVPRLKPATDCEIILKSFITCNIKVKCSLLQALRFCTGLTPHRGSRGTALLFLDHGARRGEGSASRPGCSLPPGKIRYALYRRVSGPQGRYGQVREISLPPGFDPRTVHPLASRYTVYATQPNL